jgi:hypothetical protein
VIQYVAVDALKADYGGTFFPATRLQKACIAGRLIDQVDQGARYHGLGSSLGERMVRKAKSAQFVTTLESIPNIGLAMADDLRLLGIDKPTDLIGKDPYEIYQDLCIKTGVRQDPCVLDTFIAATRFMAGEPPYPWWHYTAERKHWFTS